MCLVHTGNDGVAMSVAYGRTGKESGLNGQIIRARQLEAIAEQ